MMSRAVTRAGRQAVLLRLARRQLTTLQLVRPAAVLLPSYPAPQQQQARWMSRKGARMGQHLDSLNEQAHRGTRQEAKELRKQKKQQGKKGSMETMETTMADVEEVDFDDDDDDDHDDDDDPQSLLPDPAIVKQKMLKVVDRLETSFQSIRGAEATPEIFDAISVAAYGGESQTPLAGVAQVVIVSPTLAHVTCYDPALGADVRNAIRDSLDLNPQLDDDGLIKVPLPRASMESRQQTVKQLLKQAEAARGRIRNIRRKAMDVIKKGKDGKLDGISKDDAFRVGKEIDAVADEVTKTVTDVAHAKEESVMAV
jgi:ribosome recycling factor